MSFGKDRLLVARGKSHILMVSLANSAVRKTIQLVLPVIDGKGVLFFTTCMSTSISRISQSGVSIGGVDC